MKKKDHVARGIMQMKELIVFTPGEPPQEIVMGESTTYRRCTCPLGEDHDEAWKERRKGVLGKPKL